MLDTVALVFLILSLILVTNPIFKMDSHTKKLNEYRTQYAQEYGVDLDLANKNPSTLTEEEKAAYDANYEKYEAMNEAMAKDKTVQAVNADIIIAFAASFAVSVFFATLILHFFVPLLFKNGRTLGKRVFGLAVIRTNGVKISTPILFIRSMVGLFAIETMFPLAILLMMLLGMLGLIGAIILVAFAILQIGCMIATQTNSSIHDLLTDSVVVDMASQTIYESNEDLIAAQKAEAAERAARAEGTAQPVQLCPKPADKSKDEK